MLMKKHYVNNKWQGRYVILKLEIRERNLFEFDNHCATAINAISVCRISGPILLTNYVLRK